MRAVLLGCVLVLAAGCGEKGPATFRARNAAEWRALLADDDKRYAAIDELREGGADAIPVLVELCSAEPPVPLIAVQLIGELGPDAKPALPALTDALGDPKLRGIALAALGQIGRAARPALAAVKALRDDEDPRVRIAATATAWRIGGELRENIARLVMALEENDPGPRAMAVESLGAIGTPAIGQLLKALGHGEAHVRAAAAEAVGAIGPEARRARPRLYELLKDESAIVRQAAAKALETTRG